MSNRELEMYKLQDIIQALLQGVPIKRISRLSKVSKNTVKKYRKILNTILIDKPEIEHSIKLIMDEFHRIRKEERYSGNYGWLETQSDLVEHLSGKCDNHVRLIEKLNEKGFVGSYSSLLRYLKKNEATSEKPIVRIETKAGEVAQVDFGYIGKIFDEGSQAFIKAYVFVMVLCYSRDAYYEIVKRQDIETWCSCHVHAFEHFNGVPEVIIPDNLKSAIIKASFMAPEANRSYADCARHYGFQIDPCLPGTPEHKGKVESGVKYVKNNFIPLREFKNFTDANAQLSEWNERKARVRIHGTTRRQPRELFDKYEMESLTHLPRDRFEVPVWKQPKVYRDIHIQFDNAYYSAPHELRGKRLWTRKTASQIAIFHENRLVAVHFPALPGKRSTNNNHYPPDKRNFMKYDTDYCLKKSKEIGDNTFKIVHRLLMEEPIRNLRSAQNITRMVKKFGRGRLEEACKCAVFFGNYTYGGIKNILEKGLKTQEYLHLETPSKKLDATYARDINQLLNEEVTHGINGTN